MNLNKAFVLGRLTATPELRTTPNGQSVTSFGVATNRTWTDKTDTKQEEVEFHNVVIWGKQAEVATTFLSKGSLVFIEGRIATRKWTDKDGVERKSTEIICENMQLGPKPGSDLESAKSKPGKAPAYTPKEETTQNELRIEREEENLEDIPF